MYCIYRCKDYDGESLYNVNSIIGLYDNYDDAKKNLIDKLNKLKYEYEYQIDDDEYCFIMVNKKNGKDISLSYVPCFEIIKKGLTMNAIKLR